MAQPFCANNGAAQAALLAAEEQNEVMIRQVLTGILHDVRGAVSLLEKNKDLGRLEPLIDFEAWLQEELK